MNINLRVAELTSAVQNYDAILITKQKFVQIRSIEILNSWKWKRRHECKGTILPMPCISNNTRSLHQRSLHGIIFIMLSWTLWKMYFMTHILSENEESVQYLDVPYYIMYYNNIFYFHFQPLPCTALYTGINNKFIDLF